MKYQIEFHNQTKHHMACSWQSTHEKWSNKKGKKEIKSAMVSGHYQAKAYGLQSTAQSSTVILPQVLVELLMQNLQEMVIRWARINKN